MANAQLPPPVQQQQWWDDDPGVTARAENLLAQMTLEEKVDMVHGELNNSYGFYNAPIERLGIPALTMSDGRNGVRLANGVNNNESTLMPSGLNVASSWDAEIAARTSSVVTDEGYRTGQNLLLSPSLNIARVAQNGRNFENFGEDPLLQGRMGTAYSLTTQEFGGMVSNLQNWAAYTQETNRLEGGNSVVGERALQEIYNRPFDIAWDNAHTGSVMCAFNKVNGEYSCGSDELINVILKEQIGFEGWVMTDYGAGHGTLEINAGLDQEMPGNTDPAQQPGTCFFCQPLIDAINSGQVSIDTLNESVLRILRPMIGLGLLDRTLDPLPFDEAAHNEEAGAIAEESMVLLKNDDDVLPFSEDIGSIAVIGTDADSVVQGGGSSHIAFPTSETSPLAGIRNRLADTGAEVTYVPGTDPVTTGATLPGAQPIPSSFFTPTGGAPGATGLSAQYWQNQDFSGTPVLAEVEPYVGLNAGFLLFTDLNANSPKFVQPQSLNGNISARWSGTLTAPTTGTYELEVLTNGITTLTVDGRQVINVQEFFTPTAEASNQTVTVPLDFTAGSTHTVEMTYVFDTSSAWNQSDAQIKLGWTPPEGTVLPQAENAAAQAAEADAAVVVVRDYSTEGADRPSLELPNWQPELIRAVGEANPNAVVVMTVGGAATVVDWQDAVDGLLHAFYPGQNQGTTIASLLFGDTNPSGKLPLTMPVDDELTPTSTPAQYPGLGVDTEFSEGIFTGYRGYQEFDLPTAYPFGYGLSYTDFHYGKLRFKCSVYVPEDDATENVQGVEEPSDTDAATEQQSAELGESGMLGRYGEDGWGKGKDKGSGGKNCINRPLQLSLWVTNTGDRAGAEVIQAYAGELEGADVPTAEKSLAGWAKVWLEPGESRRVTIPLDVQSFSYWDVDADMWVTPPGDVRIHVGTSVDDTPLETTLRIRESGDTGGGDHGGGDHGGGYGG